MRTTTLSQSRYVNIEWYLFSHPEYVNQALETRDLQSQMGMDSAAFELLPHSISHTTSKGTRITTKALKVRYDYNSRQLFFTRLLECLKKGAKDEQLDEMLNTAE